MSVRAGVGRCAAVIPARYGARRLPGKPLLDLAGRPMIVRVLERVRLARRVDEVLVATDDQRIADAVQAAGGVAVMTPSDLPAGSDRVALVARGLDVDVIVNVQGDEPLIDPATIDAVVGALDQPGADVATAMATLSEDEAHATERVKVVTDQSGRALYFSRAAIPHGGPWWVHVGIYAFRKAALARFAALPPTALELAERLEQLRLLEHGVPIQVVTVARPGRSIDTLADLEAVRALLARTADPLP